MINLHNQKQLIGIQPPAVKKCKFFLKIENMLRIFWNKCAKSERIK